jgi:hypothetical protein
MITARMVTIRVLTIRMLRTRVFHASEITTCVFHASEITTQLWFPSKCDHRSCLDLRPCDQFSKINTGTFHLALVISSSFCFKSCSSDVRSRLNTTSTDSRDEFSDGNCWDKTGAHSLIHFSKTVKRDAFSSD